MRKEYQTFHPKGFSTVNPYIFSENTEELIDFLQKAFYAEVLNKTIDTKTKEIANCILEIGYSCFMISQARGEFLNMRSSFYLFVADVDALYKNAIEFGGKSALEPADMSYDDRQAGIIDPSGNYWWISKRLKEEDYSD